jgi:hypothetical protein
MESHKGGDAALLIIMQSTLIKITHHIHIVVRFACQDLLVLSYVISMLAIILKYFSPALVYTFFSVERGARKQKKGKGKEEQTCRERERDVESLSWR